MTDWKIGDSVFVSGVNRSSEYTMTVTKVGRKWITCDYLGMERRFSLETLRLDNGGYREGARVYRSRDERNRRIAWGGLSSAMQCKWEPPDGIETNAIVQAAALLGIEIVDAAQGVEIVMQAPDASVVTDEAVEAALNDMNSRHPQLGFRFLLKCALLAALPHLKLWDSELVDSLQVSQNVLLAETHRLNAEIKVWKGIADGKQDVIKQLERQASTKDAEIERLRKALTDIGAALGTAPDSDVHAQHNLMGARHDLKRGLNDRICWNTIERVADQIAEVEDILESAALGDAT